MSSGPAGPASPWVSVIPGYGFWGETETVWSRIGTTDGDERTFTLQATHDALRRYAIRTTDTWGEGDRSEASCRPLLWSPDGALDTHRAC